ncbi:acyl carrier protein [Streptomyces sp. JJ38]|nr:acyl carrier protein [Streptomyces sp. JJ38]
MVSAVEALDPGLADADPDATYHALGLDSLTLAEISLRIERDFEVPVDDTEITEEFSLRSTAQLVDEKLAHRAKEQ